MISTILHNRDYEKRVAIAISCNGSMDYFWNFAVGLKIREDAKNEFWPKFDPRRIFTFEDQREYLKDLISEFRNQGADAFLKYSTTKKDKTINCRIHLSNFSITILIHSDCAKMFFNNSYNSIEINIPIPAKEIVTWLLKRNEEMPAFREEWEEHCTEIRAKFKAAEILKQTIMTRLEGTLKDTDARISIEPDFLEDGMYLILTGEKPKMRILIPNYFDRIEEFVSLTDNIIRNKLAEDLLYQ